jgi:hypothetical protein
MRLMLDATVLLWSVENSVAKFPLPAQGDDCTLFVATTHAITTLISKFMKANIAISVLLLVAATSVLTSAQAQTPEPAKAAKAESASKKAEEPKATVSQKPLPADPEERFKFLFTKSYLSGRWAPLKDGALGEERTGDKYQIVSVAKGSGENWVVNAKLKYRDQEIVLPFPVRMKFDGDTAILIVDELMIPGGGTYSARLMIYERTYSGSWKGQRGGGMLYGTITHEAE